MGILSNLFGKKIDFDELIQSGAKIIDVRSKEEFQSGNVRGSLHIPLDQLRNNLSKLDKNKTYITCCASGMRSSSAKSLMKSSGFNHVHNGGSWSSLRKFSEN
jgi:rhodanese-related sulfurtransferase